MLIHRRKKIDKFSWIAGIINEKQIYNKEVAFGYFVVAIQCISAAGIQFFIKSFNNVSTKASKTKELLSFLKQQFVASNNGFTLGWFYEFFMFTELDVRKYNFKRKLPHKFVCTSVPMMQILEGHWKIHREVSHFYYQI